MGVGRKQERYNGRMSMTADNTTRPRKKGPIAIEGARIVGFALLLAWFSASGFLVSSATANSADFLTLVAFTALLFIAAFVGRSRDIRRQATILCSVFSAVAAVGTIVPSFTADSPIISIICSLLTAPGLALLVLGWGSLFSKRSMPTVILETIAAQLLMSAIHLTGCLQPPHLEAVLRGIYLIGSAFMFAIAAKATQPTKLSHLPSGQHDHSQSATKWQPFVRFIIAINLWGAAINLLYNIYRYCAPLDFEDLSAPAALIEIALLGLLLVVASRQRVKDTQLYTIIFATVLLAFLLVPILGIQNGTVLCPVSWLRGIVGTHLDSFCSDLPGLSAQLKYGVWLRNRLVPRIANCYSPRHCSRCVQQNRLVPHRAQHPLPDRGIRLLRCLPTRIQPPLGHMVRAK